MSSTATCVLVWQPKCSVSRRAMLQKSGLRYVKEIHDVKDAPPSLLYSISVDEWLRNLEVNASV